MKYSIVPFINIKQSSDLRIDAEYWHPDFIKNSKLVSNNKKIKNFINQNILNIKSHPLNRKFEYLEISKISLNNLVHETTCIQEGGEPSRAHFILKKNDVVVSTVRPNRNAVAFIDKNDIVGSSGLCVLRSKNIEPEYLFSFCKTNYFVKCLIRANKTSMYPAVSSDDIINVPFFIPSEVFRKKIVENIKKAHSYKLKAKEMFIQAQNLLLSELDLVSWKPKHKLTFIKNYSDTKQANRIDAEYYQPKYEEILNKIKSYKGGWDKLENIIFLKDTNFQPKEEQYYKYIELSHISNNGEITDCITEKGKHLPTRARRIVSKGDVIISSIEGSLSKIALINQDYHQAFCSTGFYVIKSNILNSETVLLIMKCLIGQLQLKKGCSGMILSAINKDELLKTISPIIKKNIQDKIQKYISEVSSLRKKSNQLLKNSTMAIEKAIKKNEQVALKWLNNV